MRANNSTDTRSLSDWLSELAPAALLPNEDGESHSQSVPSGSQLLLSVARSAMACEFEVLLNQHQYADAANKAMEALDIIDDMERLLSVYKTHSDLSILNRFGAERPTPLSYDTHRLLSLAKDAHTWTQGTFDITAGSLSDLWGFSRRDAAVPTPAEIEAALELVGGHQVTLTEESNASLAQTGVKVNPGGIGKGYALDRAAGKLVEQGIRDFMIHGGLSSILAVGHRRDGRQDGWRVSLKHPFRWEQHLGTVNLRNQALATSGSGKQFFHFRGKRYSHIIDPRTGWPAQHMMSVTVLCASAAIADILATSFFVAGAEFIEDFCRQHPQIAAIVVRQEKSGSRFEIIEYNLPENTWVRE